MNNDPVLLILRMYQQATQKELEEQEERLQRLRQLGKDLIEDSGRDEETTKEIEAQLQDFDDCWNHVAKRVIDEKEKVRKTYIFYLLLVSLLIC